MKAYLLLILGFSPFIGFSQIKVDGFYVTMNDDTVRVTFKIPKKSVGEVSDLVGNKIDFSAMKERVEIIDSSGQLSQLMPSSSKSLEFKHKSKVYKLYAMPVDHHHWCFLRPEVMGSKMRLLYFIIEHPKRKVTTGAFGSTQYSTLEEYFWTFEKYDGTHLFLRSTMKEKEIASLLKDYFKDDPKIQELVDKKFQPFSFGEIPTRIKSIVEAYNAS